jgi:hypothetical protein
MISNHAGEMSGVVAIAEIAKANMLTGFKGNGMFVSWR